MNRVRGALAVAISVAALPGAAVGTERPRVDAAVQVTGAVNPFRAYASPVVAVHPRSSRTVVVAHGEARSSGCGVHLSTDGGLSWTEGASRLPRDVHGCVRNTNGPIADLAFAPDGTLYYAFAGYPKPNDFRPLRLEEPAGRPPDLPLDLHRRREDLRPKGHPHQCAREPR